MADVAKSCASEFTVIYSGIWKRGNFRIFNAQICILLHCTAISLEYIYLTLISLEYIYVTLYKIIIKSFKHNCRCVHSTRGLALHEI